MLIIGSHVSFTKDKQLLGSVLETISYGANAMMIYTGAPQNTIRVPLDKNLTSLACEQMNNKIDIKNVIVHAPYIINLANKSNLTQYEFAIDFLIRECKRVEKLGLNKMVLHPGNSLKDTKENAISNIAEALNLILSNTKITILLETMSGKGTEVGSSLKELKQIVDKIENKNQIGICLDTCHLSDSGYDLSNFEALIEELKKYQLLDKVGCIHVNDSKNPKGSKKDRHENLGFGFIPYQNLLNIIYHPLFENIPKILETPWVEDKAPYALEIQAIKNKKFDPELKQKIKKTN